MRRAAAITVMAGLLALALAAALSSTRQAFTLGVTPIGVAVDLLPGEQACQRRVQAPPRAPAATAVRLRGRATGARPTRFAVRVGDAAGSASMPAADGADATARLDRPVTLQRPGAVCVQNLGPDRLQLFGSGAVAARTSELVKDGADTGTDLTLVFERAPRPRIARAAEVLAGAGLWRAGWVGPWTYVVLLGLAVVAGPALLLRALRERRP